MVIPQIASDPQLASLRERLATARGVLHVSGLWGSAAPMLVALAAAPAGRTILYVTAHAEGADHVQDDLDLFLPRPCALFPAWESLPGEGPSAGEIDAERLAICAKLSSGFRVHGSQTNASTAPAGAMQRRRRGAGVATSERPSTPVGSNEPLILVAPILALMQPVPTPAALARNTLSLVAGERPADPALRSPEGLLAWAIDRGYERLDIVEQPGDVARRGDIIDLFAPGQDHPLRIQFFDDTVESIRRFDLDTRRSLEDVRAISIAALPTGVGRASPPASSVARASPPAGLGESPPLDVEELFAYLPPDTLVVLENPGEIQEMGAALLGRLRAGSTAPRPGTEMFEVTDVLQAAARFACVHLSRFGGGAVGDEQSFHFETASLSRFEGKAGDAVAALIEAAGDHAVHVICDNEGEKRRLEEMLAEAGQRGTGAIHLHVGLMHRGFEWRVARTIVLPHHELFHRQRPLRRLRKLPPSRPLESWTDLKPGDFVVHLAHGIGVFRGLKTMSKTDGGQSEEFLTLEFADDAFVHVPSSQIELVQKYIGAGGATPTLSKIGGKRWKIAKQQVAEAVHLLAEDLLRIQASRMNGEGHAYPADTEWQREFEASFLYEETEDQLIVARQIREDLMTPRPMDRLVCGDVGFGKTELAMRAAFKVMEYGRQVAVLVPTTVLAEQHHQTFRERMAEYPFRIGCLSRFRSKGEQATILNELRHGRLDVVIGTHRLLSKDVAFANLGLVVIDEEQRFGVEHKERLKTLREMVDVLTLSATPIPRTLHMATAGLRDISRLETPPVDRRAIATQVLPFSRSLIREAILREMNRDGQVYFVHNIVRSIEAMTQTIKSIVPEARIVYGHGQMSDNTLENVMHRFLRKDADVLVATTIIESGIDVPTANTIFINHADRFGLADLHQLRGRVGRSKHKAYCYLLLSPDRPPNPKAVKRLKAIEEFSELGAGFRIAMRDLEIRGAGNLLGSEQSGHIAAVGYELYVQMLNRAVKKIKNEPDPDPPQVQIDLDVSAQIPSHYIASERMRMEAYRRIVRCRTVEDLQQFERDLNDAYGKLPAAMSVLLDLAELRVRAGMFGIRSIQRKPPDVIFVIENVATVEPVFRDAPGTVRLPDQKTVHLRLPPNYLEPRSLIAVLRRMLVRGARSEKSAKSENVGA